MTDEQSVDALLTAVRHGDIGARDELVNRIHPELKRMARALMTGERRDHTLGASGSGLVNLLWIKLLHPDEEEEAALDFGSILDGPHLIRIATRNMRQILVDYARNRKAQKRPNPKNRIDEEQLRTLGEEMHPLDPDSLDVHDALDRLAETHPQPSRAVELKYFGGLTNEEGAAAMAIPLIKFRRLCNFGLLRLRRALAAQKKVANA